MSIFIAVSISYFFFLKKLSTGRLRNCDLYITFTAFSPFLFIILYFYMTNIFLKSKKLVHFLLSSFHSTRSPPQFDPAAFLYILYVCLYIIKNPGQVAMIILANAPPLPFSLFLFLTSLSEFFFYWWHRRYYFLHLPKTKTQD